MPIHGYIPTTKDPNPICSIVDYLAIYIHHYVERIVVNVILDELQW